MILKVNKWPPGGAGIVLRLKTPNFRYFLVNFDDFLPNFRWFLEISCAHLGTVAQCSVDPQCASSAKMKHLETSQKLSETLKKNHETSRNFDQFPWISTCTKTKNKASVYIITRIYPKNANIVLNHEKKESQQHPVFPGGHPSKYWLGSMLLNFSDRTRTGVFNMIWPLARIVENFDILFQQHTCIHIQDISILCANWLNMPISEEKK